MILLYAKPSVLLPFSIIATLGFSSVQAAWVEWKVSDGGNGHYYQAVNDAEKTWADANRDALRATELSHLATITSEAEADFVKGLLQPSGPSNIAYHLGAIQLTGASEPRGDWRWVTGEPWIYTDWAPGEPNNNGGDEYTLEIGWSPVRPVYYWNDLPGDFMRRYVVESRVAPSAIPIPAAAWLLGAAVVGMAGFVTRRTV